MDWSERELCIICDEGGKLLVCSENGCPMAVHKKCMGSAARFDERGLFYCPYCLYRNAVAEKSRAWENAMSKEKALSIFIDKEIIGNSKQGEKKERAEMKRLNGNVNKTICCNSNKDTDSVYSQPVQLEEEPQGEGIESHECTRSPSPYEGSDALVLDSQNDELTGSSEGHKEDAHMKDITDIHQTTIPSRRELDDTERKGQRIGSAEEEKMEEDVQQILSAHTGIPSPYKGADASILDSQNDELIGSSEDRNEDMHVKDSTELQETSFPSRRKLDNIRGQGLRIGSAEEEQTQEETQEISAAPTGEVPLVRAHSRAKRGVKMNNLTYGESEVISLQSKRVKRSDMNKVQSPSPSKGADASRSDNKNDALSGSSEGYREDSHVKGSTEVQETIILFRRKPDNNEMQEEQRMKSAEEEKMQDGEQETSARYSDEVSLVQAHSKSKRGETNKSVSREPGVILTRSKDVKRSEMNIKESPGINFPRRSSRRSSSFNTVKNGKVNIEMQEEQRISSAEEETMQDKEQETSAASTDEVPLVRANSKSKRGVETNKSICRESEVISTRSKDVKRSEMNRKQSPGIDFPRRSSRRSSSDLGFNTVKNGNINASSSSRLLELPSAKSLKDPFRNDRRKKLLWTEEEQEMLQEGVEKFSSQANKNIPWRKVLEFGRHVFHGTRTPADLKDKWRNMAK